MHTKYFTKTLMRPRLLDLFCGAGGAAMGYYRAGFDVVGVDISPQKHYPFEFHQADALEYCAMHGREFDVIHASPPCQFASEATPITHKHLHHNYIPDLQNLLIEIGKPYIIENVEGARKWLVNPVMLCGTMFAMPIWRHRYFEINSFFLLSPATCNHRRSPITFGSGSNTRKTWIPVLTTGGGDSKGSLGHGRKVLRPRECIDILRWAIGIDWMTRDELDQAIPPAYTEWIGKQLLERIK